MLKQYRINILWIILAIAILFIIAVRADNFLENFALNLLTDLIAVFVVFMFLDRLLESEKVKSALSDSIKRSLKEMNEQMGDLDTLSKEFREKLERGQPLTNKDEWPFKR